MPGAGLPEPERGAPVPTVGQLRSLVAYNTWANGRLLEAAGKASPEQLSGDMKASFGSLLGTLVHIVWGERRWLQFWRTGELLPEPEAGEIPDLPTLVSRWETHDGDYSGYLRGLTPAELEAPRAVGPNTYALGELVHHILNHSSYHRGQVALLLRQLGHEPPSTDYRLFLTVTRGGRP